MAGYFYSDAGATWTTWVTASSSTDTTTTAWHIWCDNGTAGTANMDSSTITVDATWTTWAIGGANDTSTYYRTVQPVELTAEQREEQERRREAQRVRDEEAQREREAAVARAEELLLAHLDEAQRNQYAREQSFQLVKDDRIYLIQRGRAQNVYLLDECGRRVVEYCAHVIPDIPDEDNLLAQKFMIETNEAEFLRLANSRRLAV